LSAETVDGLLETAAGPTSGRAGRSLIPAILTAACIAAPACGMGGSPPGGTSDPQAQTPELFTDVAQHVGLDFVHFNGMSGEKYMVEMMGPGGAFLDYDGDGDQDVLVLQGRMLGEGKTIEDALIPPRGPLGARLFRNDLRVAADGSTSLRFVDVTAASGLVADGYGMGVATGDIDNDADVDLYVTNFGGNRMFRNNGDGTFEDVTQDAGTEERRWSVPAAFFDYDRDGWLDLYVGNYVAHRLASNKRCYSEAGYLDYCGPKAYDPEPDRLFHNRGDGTFEDVTRRSGLGSVRGPALGAIPLDANGDSWIDLYVANDGAANYLWTNRGDGSFVDDALLAGCAVNRDGAPEASMGVDAGDFDNDGDEDLFMTHLSKETNTLYVNDGRGTFEDATVRTGLGAPRMRYTGFGTAWIDYDNDGWLDLLVVNGAVTLIEEQLAAGDPYPLHQSNQLFRNTGGGTFEDVSARAGEAFELSEVGRGAAFGDVDNDGDTDVLVINNAGPVRLLINRVGQDRRWVGLRLVTRDGRDALGAWVGVFTTQGTRHFRRVRTSGSYASANDPRVLVGLDDAASVERVEVRWPDGGAESFTDVPLGVYTTLREGTGR
jgi:hypothetical protein